MSTSEDVFGRELAIEQAHVDTVYLHLSEATAQAKSLVKSGRERFQTDRNDFLRADDATALFERDAFAFQAAKRLAILDAQHDGLVFGRLDLVPSETRYIGRIGVRDGDYNPLVIDWRAPAAEPFYRATSTDPMKVIRRRVLQCRDDRVIGIEDDLLDGSSESNLVIVGEGALMASLKRSRGRNMLDIVSTIQAEQDEAIRAPYQGVTMITGGPGTGKTVVALHRCAYLLYTNRRRFESGGVLVVGPSSVFMNYIERVLPSLGEDSVTLRSIGSLASDVLGTHLERFDDPHVAALKGSLRMLPLLRNLVREPLIPPEDLFLRVTIKGEALILRAPELADIRNQVLKQFRLNPGRPHAEAAVVAALAAKLPQDVDVDEKLVPGMIEQHASLKMFMNAWWPELTPMQVLARLQDLELAWDIAFEFADEEVEALVDSFEWLAANDNDSDVQTTGWSVADLALLDELVAMLGPVSTLEETPVFVEGGEVAELVTIQDSLRRPRDIDPLDDNHETYSHVLVDEAQDITPMQWRMLKRRGASASWTIVGDPAQSSYPNQAESKRALRDVIGRNASREFKLSTNYRSPKEVFDLASAVITKVYPDADVPRAVRTTGIEPVVARTSPSELLPTLKAHVLAIASALEGSIAIVCPASRIRAITRFVFEDSDMVVLEPRLSVVTALQSKGLEYDGVVVVAPDDILAESPGGTRVLYVALTRATQRLVTLDVNKHPRWNDYLA